MRTGRATTAAEEGELERRHTRRREEDKWGERDEKVGEREDISLQVGQRLQNGEISPPGAPQLLAVGLGSPAPVFALSGEK